MSVDDAKRLDDIRERVQLDVTDQGAEDEFNRFTVAHFYTDDVPYLLSRVEELERENERLRQERRELIHQLDRMAGT